MPSPALRATLILASCALLAPTLAEPAPAAAQKSLAATLNVYVFPNAGQKPEQQSKDEGECYTWAVAQSGIDPFAQQKAAAADQAAAQQQQQQAAAGAKKGGGPLRGAAVGAVIADATGGDGDKGAAAGAALGAIKKGKQQAAAQQQAQAAQQQAATAAQANAQAMGNFNKAFSVCLEGKKYMVKY